MQKYAINFDTKNLVLFFGVWENATSHKISVDEATFEFLLRQDSNGLKPFSICFINCEFDFLAVAKKAYNFKDLCFYKCCFNKRVAFNSIKIKKEVSFVDTVFKSELTAIDSTFGSRLHIDQCQFKSNVYFRRCHFNDRIAFKTSNFDRLLVLNECTLKNYLPDFRFSQFTVYPDTSSLIFDEENIKNQLKGCINQEEKLKKAAFICRKLKQIASLNQNHQRQQEFFALEMQALSLSGERKAFRIFSKMYEFFSLYGRSIRRPMFSLLLVFLMFFLVNIFLFGAVSKSSTVVNSAKFTGAFLCLPVINIKLMANSSKQNTSGESQQCFLGIQVLTPQIWQALVLTLSNSLPFGLGIQKEDFTWYISITKNPGFKSILIQSLQWLQFAISTIFWFLFFLAIRNRFLIK